MEEMIQDTLHELGMTQPKCPHCGCEDQSKLTHNWNFTHAHHIALNYQCHNRPTCDKYFQIGPLESCCCGWRSPSRMIEITVEVPDGISE